MSYHYIVGVVAIIFKDAKVLAMRRSQQKDAGAGLWETLSGRVEPGEEPLETVKREIQEESGLQVQIDPRPVTSYLASRKGEPMILIVYRADYLAGEVIRSEEHDKHAWLSPTEFAHTTSLDKLSQAVFLAYAL